MKSTAGTVGVISNPSSGHNRDQFDAIRATIEQYPAIHHRITRHQDDIKDALQDLAARSIDVLAINGGDGTAAATLGALLESSMFTKPPLIALLPGGTANMNAGDIGITGSLAKAVQRLCQWSAGHGNSRQKIVQRRLMRVFTDTSQSPHYGMFLGAGAVVHGTNYAHKEIHSRGLRDDFSLALGTMRTVWGVLRNDPRFNRHVTIKLGLDDLPPVQYDTLILAVSTLQRLSFGMRPFWSSEPGLIRVTLMEQGCTQFARTFFSIVRGQPNRNATPSAGYNSHNANRMRLEMHGTINLDGELLPVNTAVEVHPSTALEFLRL